MYFCLFFQHHVFFISVLSVFPYFLVQLPQHRNKTSKFGTKGIFFSRFWSFVPKINSMVPNLNLFPLLKSSQFKSFVHTVKFCFQFWSFVLFQNFLFFLIWSFTPNLQPGGGGGKKIYSRILKKLKKRKIDHVFLSPPPPEKILSHWNFYCSFV